MALNRRKLKEWVTRRTLTPPLAIRFALWHSGKHGLSLVCQLATEGGTEDWPDVIERQVSEEAQDHANGWPGRQQYLVQAYTEKSDESIGEFALSMTASNTSLATTSLSLLDNETPDAELMNAGNLPPDFNHPHALVTTQQMRHTEALTRYVVELSMASRERDGQIIAVQQKQIDEMSKSRLDMTDMLEKMLSRSQERSLVQDKYDKEQGRKDKIMSTLLGFVLPEMARRAGVPLPEDVSNDIRLIFLKLPDEMQNEIMAALPEDDKDKLMDIFEGKTETTH